MIRFSMSFLFSAWRRDLFWFFISVSFLSRLFSSNFVMETSRIFRCCEHVPFERSFTGEQLSQATRLIQAWERKTTLRILRFMSLVPTQFLLLLLEAKQFSDHLLKRQENQYFQMQIISSKLSFILLASSLIKSDAAVDNRSSEWWHTAAFRFRLLSSGDMEKQFPSKLRKASRKQLKLHCSTVLWIFICCRFSLRHKSR